MPQVADPVIAATWDEIELEAALRDPTAEPPPAGTAPSLSEALRAVEELKRLPKAERKRRAEELLLALTSAAPSGEQTPEPSLSEPISSEETQATEPAAVSPEIFEPPTQVSVPIETAAGVSLEVSETQAQGSPSASFAAGMSPDITEPVAQVLLDPEPVAEASSAIAELSPEQPPPSDGMAVEAPLELCAPTPIGKIAAVEDSAGKPAPNARIAEPTPEAVREPSSPPPAAAEPYSIPKFLATECPSRELEHPDSLIPLRSALAACAVVGAVLLIYFGSSQEFGVAARPIVGARNLAEMPAAPANISPSVAVRQAFVTEPPAYSAASEPVRSYRPPFVGFDFLDDTASPVPTAAKAEAAQEPSPPPPQAVIMPPPPVEETAALSPPPAEETMASSSLPPAPDADLAALLKRGDALLKAGDIAAARSAYERAATTGSAKAEIGVGKTYDPLVLAKLGARGVRGDPVEAASWYARAGEAGDEEGQQRLHALISGLSDCMLSQGACAPRKP